MQRWFIVFALAATSLAPSAAGQQRWRPGEGRTRQPSPPIFLQYHPRAALIVPAHRVPRAKHPVIDVHGHPPTLLFPEGIDRVGQATDSLQLQIVVNANGSSGDHFTHRLVACPDTQSHKGDSV